MVSFCLTTKYFICFVKAGYSLVGTFLSVSSEVFLEIAQCSEEFCAIAAVESFSVMQAKMSSQSIPSVECFFASTFGAFERFNL